ncbi:hypothetical protein BJ878DRAFT_547993 [Calycina marina]|uniref:Thioester reductase (TE) domain-containing protein n=1 Tax=Calycina marina TaxID=1763456 RepID=A0A9P8CFR9_9HELO|nr:hypothetical protein BJ878DRAFT_547993 [Calycina marina]
MSQDPASDPTHDGSARLPYSDGSPDRHVVECKLHSDKTAEVERGIQYNYDGGYLDRGVRIITDAIETWMFGPAAVPSAVKVLKSRVKQYVHISTIILYDNYELHTDRTLNDENVPCFDVDARGASKSGYQYNKRSVEIATEKSGLPRLFVRLGIILGPREASMTERERLTWWLHHIEKGVLTLVPKQKEIKMQLVDACDLANFVLDTIVKKLVGAYNIIEKYDDTYLSWCTLARSPGMLRIWRRKAAKILSTP